MVEKISSDQNPKIKNLIRLHKSNERRKQKLFLVEGKKEIDLAISAGYKIHSVFISNEFNEHYQNSDSFINRNIPNFEIPQNIFSKIAYRESSDGLLAVFHQREINFDTILLKKNPFVIVIESIEKPGNLGAILRTADAAGADAIIICDPKTDIYNPNVVRSSIGCLFTNQIICCKNEDAVKWLRKNDIKIHAALLSDKSETYHTINYTLPSAIVLGTEAEGLTDFWIKNSDSKIIIPMRGKIDSLNVSVSTAIITFEAMRQRGFRG